MKRILVTGAAGFIGWRTAELLLDRGWAVTGLDNLNDYYDTRLKRYRLDLLRSRRGFSFVKADIEDRAALARVFRKTRFDAVINLAARAGVRYSLVDPYVYVRTNTMGALNLLELCHELKVPKFIQASTSSLYENVGHPSRETDSDKAVSPYAASKKGAEALCQAYQHLYGMDVTVLRYFTVYGPAGRPDMSPFRFTEWIRRGRAIELFGDGSQRRDFTFIDDIAEGTVAALGLKGYHLVNLGDNQPHTLSNLIRTLEKHLGREALIRRRPSHKADQRVTWANVSEAKRLLGWKPKVSFEEGMRRTVNWHQAHFSWLGKIDL